MANDNGSQGHGAATPKTPYMRVALAPTLLALGLSACTPSPQLLTLADGTEVFHLSNTLVKPAVGYPRPRELKIDGEAFVRTPESTQPLIIHTRLMVLTVSGVS